MHDAIDKQTGSPPVGNLAAARAEAPPQSRRRRILSRILSILALGIVIASLISALYALSNRQTGRAGFGRGILHGALMPIALPNLLVGQDVTIYAPDNTGRSYKIGYIVGVNACGLLFFGFFFWRMNRLRKSFKRGP